MNRRRADSVFKGRFHHEFLNSVRREAILRIVNQVTVSATKSQTFAALTVIDKLRHAFRKNLVLSCAKNDALKRLTDAIFELKARSSSLERVVHVSVHNLLLEVGLSSGKLGLFGLQAVLKLLDSGLRVLKFLLDSLIGTLSFQFFNLRLSGVKLGLKSLRRLKLGFVVAENAFDVVRQWADEL